MDVLPDGPTPVICIITSPSFAHAPERGGPPRSEAITIVNATAGRVRLAGYGSSLPAKSAL